MRNVAAEITSDETVPSEKNGKVKQTGRVVGRSGVGCTYVEGNCCSNLALMAEAISCSVV